ncbi:hypothetical protein Tco_0700575 [Tanacetum coccineum]
MNKIKSANRNTTNYHLYHALMEALIADEDAMDKEVADKVKDHKRKHDSDDDEDDDDDEGPSAGSNQGKQQRGDDTDSALTSTGWQITDTRDAVGDSSMHRSDLEQSSDDIPMQDDGHVSDMEDTDNAHIPKVSTTTWFKPIPEGERPATPEPEWTIPPNDFPEPENNWANTYATTFEQERRSSAKADLEVQLFNLVTRCEKLPYPYQDSKAARYLDFGIEELVPSLWVESERNYDISAVYDITHWWFRRKEFYINKHSEPSDRDS